MLRTKNTPSLQIHSKQPPKPLPAKKMYLIRPQTWFRDSLNVAQSQRLWPLALSDLASKPPKSNPTEHSLHETEPWMEQGFYPEAKTSTAMVVQYNPIGPLSRWPIRAAIVALEGVQLSSWLFLAYSCISCLSQDSAIWSFLFPLSGNFLLCYSNMLYPFKEWRGF